MSDESAEYMAEFEDDLEDEPEVDVNGNLIEHGSLVPEYVRMRFEHDTLAAKVASLDSLLVEQKGRALEELVASVVGWTSNYGFQLEELLGELSKRVPKVKAKPKAKAKSKQASKVTLFADAACPGQIYKRGPYPAWMRKRMDELGMDASDPDQRKQYKDAYLQAVGVA